MKLKLNASMDVMGTDMQEIIDILEENLGPEIPHGRMTMQGFHMSEKWRIDHCIDHWVLVLDRKHTTQAYFTEFMLRWGS